LLKISYAQHVSWFKTLLMWFHQILDELLGHGEFLHYSPFFNIIAKDFCDKQLPAIVCENILFLIAGFDAKETNIVSRSRVLYRNNLKS